MVFFFFNFIVNNYFGLTRPRRVTLKPKRTLLNICIRVGIRIKLLMIPPITTAVQLNDTPDNISKCFFFYFYTAAEENVFRFY